MLRFSLNSDFSVSFILRIWNSFLYTMSHIHSIIHLLYLFLCIFIIILLGHKFLDNRNHILLIFANSVLIVQGGTIILAK